MNLKMQYFWTNIFSVGVRTANTMTESNQSDTPLALRSTADAYLSSLCVSPHPLYAHYSEEVERDTRPPRTTPPETK